MITHESGGQGQSSTPDRTTNDHERIWDEAVAYFHSREKGKLSFDRADIKLSLPAARSVHRRQVAQARAQARAGVPRSITTQRREALEDIDMQERRSSKLAQAGKLFRPRDIQDDPMQRYVRKLYFFRRFRDKCNQQRHYLFLLRRARTEITLLLQPSLLINFIPFIARILEACFDSAWICLRFDSFQWQPSRGTDELDMRITAVELVGLKHNHNALCLPMNTGDDFQSFITIRNSATQAWRTLRLIGDPSTSKAHLKRLINSVAADYVTVQGWRESQQQMLLHLIRKLPHHLGSSAWAEALEFMFGINTAILSLQLPKRQHASLPNLDAHKSIPASRASKALDATSLFEMYKPGRQHASGVGVREALQYLTEESLLTSHRHRLTLRSRAPCSISLTPL